MKIMAHLNIAENRLPQDGRIKVKYGTIDVDVRVSIIPSVVGERVVLRLLVKDERHLNINNLGMKDEKIGEVRMMIIEKRDAAYIRDRCIEMGMSTMLDDGIEKVVNGVTTLEEVVRVIRE